jgi:hypothetical protein
LGGAAAAAAAAKGSCCKEVPTPPGRAEGGSPASLDIRSTVEPTRAAVATYSEEIRRTRRCCLVDAVDVDEDEDDDDPTADDAEE